MKTNYEYVKKWRQANPDRFKEQKLRYNKRNKEKISEYQKAYYERTKKLRSVKRLECKIARSLISLERLTGQPVL